MRVRAALLCYLYALIVPTTIALPPEPTDVASSQQSVSKQVQEDNDLVAVPWETLWIMESTSTGCDYQETIFRFGTLRSLQPEWMKNKPEDIIGSCPVRFRPNLDPLRWFPKNLVISECKCEGSPCARHSLHVCVTAFVSRTVYSLYSGKRRVLLAVGCLCALQKTRRAQLISIKTAD